MFAAADIEPVNRGDRCRTQSSSNYNFEGFGTSRQIFLLRRRCRSRFIELEDHHPLGVARGKPTSAEGVLFLLLRVRRVPSVGGFCAPWDGADRSDMR